MVGDLGTWRRAFSEWCDGGRGCEEDEGKVAVPVQII